MNIINRIMNILLILLGIAYCICPDPIPGPIDDICVSAIIYLVNTFVLTNNKQIN